jgi:hypothetical protein
VYHLRADAPIVLGNGSRVTIIDEIQHLSQRLDMYQSEHEMMVHSKRIVGLLALTAMHLL